MRIKGFCRLWVERYRPRSEGFSELVPAAALLARAQQLAMAIESLVRS